MPLSKQELVDTEKFDPTNRLFTMGCHMPVMCYMGGPNATSRSPDAVVRRNRRSEQRGWDLHGYRRAQWEVGHPSTSAPDRSWPQAASRGGGASSS